MIVLHIFSVLVILGKVVQSTAPSSALSVESTQGWRTAVDCVRASDLCNQNPQCSSRYRVMRQCLVGTDRAAMLANRECQAALEVLQDSPLFDCRCKRGMKKEPQCLQSYWSIHLGLAEEEEFYENSPYEPMTVPHPDAFRLASIISGMDAGKGGHCVDSGKPCNPCLDATKACNLNEACKRQRNDYIKACHRGPGQPLTAEPCYRKRCHRALRQFFDRVPSEFSYRLLFCACRHQACAERRRQTIVPACAFEEKTRPNCLELRRACRSDLLCRSRLADFHMNCQSTPYTITSCPNDNYHACLTSYVGLIGTDVTPNYVDASYTNISISLWCTCRGSGNHEEECEAFLRDFRDNSCLRNAIQAFGYGPDALPKVTPPPAAPATSTGLAPASVSKQPLSSNEVKPGGDACVLSTCASLKETGSKCNPTAGYVCEDTTLLRPNMESSESRGSPKMEDEEEEHSSGTHLCFRAAMVFTSSLMVKLAL
ncbi:hypothetical protein MATL_G00081650 [Megalops atlanticus]|uniref:GDNF family receptor alpha n=1 Tax=Megalops atlanticus TaxID=7932 RepID=A0A9D3Q4M2_MEGAT|nr:hypothetical protein MATL_G00081650 [Megalops atlanticus]